MIPKGKTIPGYFTDFIALSRIFLVNFVLLWSSRTISVSVVAPLAVGKILSQKIFKIIVLNLRNHAAKLHPENHTNWDANVMIKAIDAVKQGMPYKTASKQFSVPVMTLKRRVNRKNVHAMRGTKILGSIKKVFTDEQELELVQHIKDNEETMYGFTVDDDL